MAEDCAPSGQWAGVEAGRLAGRLRQPWTAGHVSLGPSLLLVVFGQRNLWERPCQVLPHPVVSCRCGWDGKGGSQNIIHWVGGGGPLHHLSPGLRVAGTGVISCAHD